MTRIIVTREKDSTGYHDASTDEQWAKSALRILTDRWNEGYWYHDPNDDGLGQSRWADHRRAEYARALALSKEEIEALPATAKQEVLGLRQEARRDSAEDQRHRQWYERAKAVVENEDVSLVTVGRGRWERQEPLAWRLLDERSDHEYERVELIDLGEKGWVYS